MAWNPDPKVALARDVAKKVGCDRDELKRAEALGLRGQCAEVYEFMRLRGSITAGDAIDFGCHRLASRVLDLKKYGIRIDSKREKNGNGGRHARYFLRRN